MWVDEYSIPNPMSSRTLLTSLLVFLLRLLAVASFSYHRTASLADQIDFTNIGNKKCEIKQEHFTAYGRWSNARNLSSGLNAIIPLIPHHELKTVIREDMRGQPILAGSTNCPLHPTDDNYDHGSLMSRSLCPWYWRVNYDPKRIPASLPEAVCRCTRAVTGSTAVSYECQPLTINMRVMRFDSNCNHYEEKSEPLTIACVSVVHSSSKLVKHHGIEQSQDSAPTDA